MAFPDRDYIFGLVERIVEDDGALKLITRGFAATAYDARVEDM